MSKTTIKTLRYYDEIGLLKPEYTDPFTNYRFYTTEQLVRIHHIQSLRQIGLVPDEIKLIPAIGEKVMKRYSDLKYATPAYCFIEYLDGEYKEQNFNVEFCEAVTEMKESFEDIVFKKIQAVSAVSVIHKGPYADFDKAYVYAFKWIEDNGYTVTGSSRENYIDGIWNKEDEQDWLTELQIPIVKK